MTRAAIILTCMMAIVIGVLLANGSRRPEGLADPTVKARFSFEHQQLNMWLVTDTKTGRQYLMINDTGIVELAREETVE